MSALLGISGARRNACAALCADGRVLAVCEQERLTRLRGIGLQSGRLPAEAVDAVLKLSGRSRHQVARYVVAEPEIQLPPTVQTTAIDHHRAHAATAFLTSPFERAAVLVCDSGPERDLSVWLGDQGQLHDQQWLGGTGCGLAWLYSECAQLFEFAGPGQEHQLEGLAHLGRGKEKDRLRETFQYVDRALLLDPRWRGQIDQLIRDEQRPTRTLPVEAASAVQHRVGELLLDLVADVKDGTGCDLLCLGGGLFFNTYFTTLVRGAGLFRDVFVPINPGNAGLCVGASLLESRADGEAPVPSPVPPFLGPEYDSEAIKQALEGCKLSYAFVSESDALDQTVDALRRGHLVGWFQGRMEWGPRALGHRSILADPCSPYVLENLNCFLRKREPWRSFGVSVCEDDAADLFCGPPTSAFMEYEYKQRDDRLRHVMPKGARTLRVQTVPPEARLFWSLHKRMKQANGTGALVNTSFNGFHEPIACTPQDAVRVFYGTGLDMLVLGRFILRK